MKVAVNEHLNEFYVYGECNNYFHIPLFFRTAFLYGNDMV